MIVPMKKIAIIVQAKDADSAINRLRSEGVLHVEHQQLPQGKDISILQEEASEVSKALDILSAAQDWQKPFSITQKEAHDRRLIARHIIDLHRRLDQLQEYAKAVVNNLAQWQEWGDFEPEKIIALAQKGIFVKLYQVPVKELNRIPPEAAVKKIFTKGGVAHCVVISRKDAALPYKELALPKMGLSQLRAKKAEDEKVMERLMEDIQRHISYHDSLVRARGTLEKELEFQQVLNGMGRSGNIVFLSGYIPFDKAGLLKSIADVQKWGISITDPLEEDQVPTLIRNPRWISVISPVFKVIEIVPGYHELDISLWFLIFFSVFFGMLIGDAGYGAVYFILTLLAQLKLGKRVPQKAVFVLFYILSSCAVIWGVLSGTFFGQEWLPASIRPLVPALRNAKNVQALCFFIGALHLSIAHCWRGVIKLPSLKALADVGWVLILWGVYYLAKLLILGEAYPVFANRLFIIGAALILMFTNPRKNMLKGLAAGLGSLFLNLINNFTDVVSYIRLFAVGMATVAVADTFNKMALGIGYSTFLAGLFSSLILLLGHTLNILLGPMSILVHGVRLNVLEFCNHLNMQWSGFAYKPLRNTGERGG